MAGAMGYECRLCVDRRRTCRWMDFSTRVKSTGKGDPLPRSRVLAPKWPKLLSAGRDCAGGTANFPTSRPLLQQDQGFVEDRFGTRRNNVMERNAFTVRLSALG